MANIGHISLFSPEVAGYYPLSAKCPINNDAVPPSQIYDKTPEYVVSLDVFARESLLMNRWFEQNYDLIWGRKTDVFGHRFSQICVYRGKP